MPAHFENTGYMDPKTGEQSPKGFSLVPIRQDPYLCPPGCGCWWPLRKAIYDFTLHRRHPLTYVDAGGNQWRPDYHYESDMGSVPRLPQVLIPKDRFLGFYLHDSGYAHGGLWCLKFVRVVVASIAAQWDASGVKFEVQWVFVALTREELDDMLHDMILADPCPGYAVTADTIWSVVRAGGWAAWGKGDLRKGIHAGQPL